MRLRQGDMWSAWKQAGLFLITANSSVRKDGALVMGAGIAEQARDRFPGLDKSLGQRLLEIYGGDISTYEPQLVQYNLLVSERWPAAKLGLFQVKFHWQSKAHLDLIACAANDLHFWLLDKPQVEVHLNFPGIGNGKLDRDWVLPIVKRLPDNVVVWEHPA